MFKRFSVGFAAGYVFGARAGNKRYEQITELADKALDLPVVARLSERASETFNPENGRHFLEMLKERTTGRSSSSRDDDDDRDAGRDRYEDHDDDRDEDDGYDDDVEDRDEQDRDQDDRVEDVDEDERAELDEPRHGPRRSTRPSTRHRARQSNGGIRALASAAIERGRVR